MTRSRLVGVALALVGMTLPGAVAASPTDLADLSVTISHTPEPAQAPDDVVFTVTVANAGPATASGVALITDLFYPNGSSTSGAPFRRYDAVPTQGTCPTPTFLEPSTPVSCQLGPIGAGSSAQVIITIPTYRLKGAITLHEVVRANEADADPADNSDADVANVNGSLT